MFGYKLAFKHVLDHIPLMQEHAVAAKDVAQAALSPLLSSESDPSLLAFVAPGLAFANIF
jgi:hypothetical protein